MSSISYVLTVVPVSDLGQAIDFYTKLLGRPPELRPMEGVAEWQIGGSAWIQVSTTIGLAVDDVEEFRQECVNVGLMFGEVVDLGFVRMVEVKDPDGNHIQALEETGEALS